jgi:hypothetical protein
MDKARQRPSDNARESSASASGSGKAEVPRERGPDRRVTNVGAPTGLERRRGPGRRLSDFTKAAEEGELTPEQFLFVMAIEEFKRANARQYPTWTDVLEVVRLLGYRKTMASEITLRMAEDWRESHDTPSNVRPANWERRFANDAGSDARDAA